jgi:hypothetical protein
VPARVLKEFLPMFSTDFKCFCLPSVPIVSMGYDQKHFCHGRGIRRYATRERLKGITSKFEALRAPATIRICYRSPSEDP